MVWFRLVWFAMVLTPRKEDEIFREDDLVLATRAKWFPSVAPSHLSGRHEEVVKKATVWFQLV